MSNTETFKIIAMDGGAAVGKSSTSKGLAERLNLMHVDTGAHYRTLTHALLQTGADPAKPETIPSALTRLELGTTLQGRSAKLSVNGTVPADADIRSPEVNAAVSTFAALPSLRSFLFEYQRGQSAIARDRAYAGLIMEGRDIGSVIFPDADHRFFLYADEATRTARRAKEGQTDSIAARDQMDSNRKTAPLVCPEGAIQIDTTPLTLEEVIETITRLIQPA
ncbi:MAG: cytidylate kinase [Puniceicoccaceae bacterium]|nr:MAG: cytidylate kinase [Puniceicoccaceae bacterium]